MIGYELDTACGHFDDGYYKVATVTAASNEACVM